MKKLSNLSKVVTKKKKRVGRGYGSGKGGHTVGKGMKGQRSRSGFKKVKAWIRESNVSSLPKLRGIGKRSNKRGFKKSKIKKYVFNVSDLNTLPDGSQINLSKLKETGFISGRSKTLVVKILGDGKLERKLIVEKGIAVSDSAKKKIEKAGGKVL